MHCCVQKDFVKHTKVMLEFDLFALLKINSLLDQHFMLQCSLACKILSNSSLSVHQIESSRKKRKEINSITSTILSYHYKVDCSASKQFSILETATISPSVSQALCELLVRIDSNQLKLIKDDFYNLLSKTHLHRKQCKYHFRTCNWH